MRSQQSVSGGEPITSLIGVAAESNICKSEAEEEKLPVVAGDNSTDSVRRCDNDLNKSVCEVEGAKTVADMLCEESDLTWDENN